MKKELAVQNIWALYEDFTTSKSSVYVKLDKKLALAQATWDEKNQELIDEKASTDATDKSIAAAEKALDDAFKNLDNVKSYHERASEAALLIFGAHQDAKERENDTDAMDDYESALDASNRAAEAYLEYLGD